MPPQPVTTFHSTMSARVRASHACCSNSTSYEHPSSKLLSYLAWKKRSWLRSNTQRIAELAYFSCN
ncbi:hypothetical protein CMR86_01400 [Escherichia coli]|nr:hypothetical protein BE948_08995 [Escherichia coli]EFN7261561.1 hypothetical protein [Escherichia coli O162:H9]EHF1134406.1 hypothetical protein [Salmonella enterica subsp. enterica serovar Kentucky]OYK64491.1 hypothetical protein CI721_00775 [Shigella sonnei]HAJ6415080.1 hypothetical protein [Escherichia coli HVH 54 (4-2723514)]